MAPFIIIHFFIILFNIIDSSYLQMFQSSIIQQRPKPQLQLQYLSTFHFPKSLQISLQPPILNKIQSGQNSFYCGYSNGMIIQQTYANLQQQKQKQQDIKYNSLYSSNQQYNNQHLFSPQKQYKQVYYPYQNCDIIDIDIFNKDILLTCTHTEVTLFNVHKNKRISLRGHQQSPVAISSHPISPLVVSVSNLVIQHDLRIQKPILVNYITPPAYDVQYFPDGQFFLLSGQPIRIGKDKWMRTLQNGYGTMSRNSKFIVSNDMNRHLTLWDWRKSQKLRTIQNVNNEQTYQPVHFLSKDNDDGNLLHHDLIKNKTQRQKIIQPYIDQNWKCEISSEGQKTKHVLVYQHTKTEVKCYNIQ